MTGFGRWQLSSDDVSARDLQKKDVQWARAKGFDTFCPVGPLVSDELDLTAMAEMQGRTSLTVIENRG